jgi:hypothetical protein
MTAAIIDITARNRATARLMQRGRRKDKVFDRAAAYAKTRREIERHARYVGAAETDDLYRWLVAWVWFNPQSKDQVGAVMVSAAYAMGRRNFTEAEAEAIVEEARTTRRHMTADGLARWLGCTYADRAALRLTRIGACDIGNEARRVLSRRRKRLAKQAERRRKGVVPRAEYEAKSVAVEARAAGVNRSTIYRRRQRASRAVPDATPDATGVSPSSLSFPIGGPTPVARAKKRPSDDDIRRTRRGVTTTTYIAAAVGRAAA